MNLIDWSKGRSMKSDVLFVSRPSGARREHQEYLETVDEERLYWM